MVECCQMMFHWLESVYFLAHYHIPKVTGLVSLQLIVVQIGVDWPGLHKPIVLPLPLQVVVRNSILHIFYVMLTTCTSNATSAAWKAIQVAAIGLAHLFPEPS